MCKEQHGFCKYHSCETQLLEAINDLSSKLNAGIYTNWSLAPKAFDKVSHKRMLSKLSFYGMGGGKRGGKKFTPGRSSEDYFAIERSIPFAQKI